MRYFEEEGLRFTAHGQTPDLYEDMFGEDSDILADLLAYSNGQKDMLKNLNSKEIEQIQELAQLDLDNISYKSYQKYEKITDKINVRGHRKMRQIILCLLMQTEVDNGREPTVAELQRNISPDIYTNPKILQQAIDLLAGKEKKTLQAKA